MVDKNFKIIIVLALMALVVGGRMFNFSTYDGIYRGLVVETTPVSVSEGYINVDVNITVDSILQNHPTDNQREKPFRIDFYKGDSIGGACQWLPGWVPFKSPGDRSYRDVSSFDDGNHYPYDLALSNLIDEKKFTPQDSRWVCEDYNYDAGDAGGLRYYKDCTYNYKVLIPIEDWDAAATCENVYDDAYNDDDSHPKYLNYTHNIGSPDGEMPFLVAYRVGDWSDNQALTDDYSVPFTAEDLESNVDEDAIGETVPVEDVIEETVPVYLDGSTSENLVNEVNGLFSASLDPSEFQIIVFLIGAIVILLIYRRKL